MTEVGLVSGHLGGWGDGGEPPCLTPSSCEGTAQGEWTGGEGIQGGHDKAA